MAQSNGETMGINSSDGINGHSHTATQMTNGNNHNSGGDNNNIKDAVNESPFKRNYGSGRRQSRASLRRVETKERRESVKSEASVKSRGNWGSKWEFLLSCVGLSVGIGNVWRFPYLAYENGGGAFLIPYLIMLALAGKPMYFMELAFGQFGGYGPLKIWKCAPIAKGVGAAMVMVSIIVCIYYNVVMSYTLYFIGHSFQSQLPWERCDPQWAEGTNCTVRAKNSTFIVGSKSSSQVFWERKVLDLSPGIEELGGIKWDLALCLLISWIIVILCLLKGVKTSGKVVYFAATFPYIILISLLIAGLVQDGAWEGVKYFIVPSWDKLLSIKVWQAAAGQMFFSLSVAMGALIMFSSYNDFRHNIFQDAMVVSVLDTVTSIISGLVIFSVLGAMAHDLGPGVSVKDVVQSGPGLAFVTYPEALTRLPLPQLWSVLFFLMLFILGLDSEFALFENVLTSISDENAFIYRHKLKFCVGLGTVCFLLGLPCVTRGGQYVFEIMDTYGGGVPLIFIAVSECVALMWIYGYNKFEYDIYYMLERRLGKYWLITWKYTSPIILALIFVYSLINYHPLKYGAYDFPGWADALGICLTLIIIVQVPGWALYMILKQKEGKTFMEKLRLACRYDDDWGPRDQENRLEWDAKRSEFSSIITNHENHENQFATLKHLKTRSGSIDNPAFTNEV